MSIEKELMTIVVLAEASDPSVIQHMAKHKMNVSGLVKWINKELNGDRDLIRKVVVGLFTLKNYYWVEDRQLLLFLRDSHKLYKPLTMKRLSNLDKLFDV